MVTSIPPLCILHTEDEEDEDEEEEERKEVIQKTQTLFAEEGQDGREWEEGAGRREGEGREKGGRGEGEGRTYADLVGLQRSRSVCEGHELGFLGHSSPAIDGLLFSSSHDAKQIILGGVGFEL